jgi:hypothetical protein
MVAIMMVLQEWSKVLESWHDFYIAAAAAAATLMGLMFVVMTLGQRSLATQQGKKVTRALHTPTVAFFVAIVVVSLLVLMPATSPHTLGVLLAVVAVSGLGYMIASGAFRIWLDNELGVDDLVWYVILPYVGFAALGAAAAAIWVQAAFGMALLAGATLLLLLVGIRNAWDLVVYSVQKGDAD